jgi:hypothetical protein
MKFVSLTLRCAVLLTLTSRERTGDRAGLLIETNEHAKATHLFRFQGKHRVAVANKVRVT